MRSRVSRKSWKRKSGQALVELALAVTFIFFLLSAAIDLGLAYKTYQSLADATAEASSYLSQSPCNGDCRTATASDRQTADNQAINRFRLEQGEDDGEKRGISSLRDLNANGKDDVAGTGSGGDGFDLEATPSTTDPWIKIYEVDDHTLSTSNLNAVDINTLPVSANCATRQERILTVAASDSSYGARCYIVVKAKIIYKPFFALAPVIGKTGITIRAYAVKPIIGQ